MLAFSLAVGAAFAGCTAAEMLRRTLARANASQRQAAGAVCGLPMTVAACGWAIVAFSPPTEAIARLLLCANAFNGGFVLTAVAAHSLISASEPHGRDKWEDLASVVPLRREVTLPRGCCSTVAIGTRHDGSVALSVQPD